MRNRLIVETLKARIVEESPLIQVLIGPRQVGKTTVLKEVLKTRGIYKTADYPSPLKSEIVVDWWQEANESESKILAIDEVQKITNWSEVVKYLWDKSDGIKLIITGSSSLQVEKGLRETLAGRYELIRAEHWNFKEASTIFNSKIEEFIEYGCYPGANRFLDNIPRWGEFIRDSIVEPAIGRDLMQIHPVENPALMRQVFGVACSLPAQIVSLQKIQGQLQTKGAIATISNYLNLLSHAFLVSAIPKYSVNQIRVKSSIPKLIIHDNALIRAFERPIQTKLSHEKLGRYFENAIGARFIEAGWETYYWKNRNLEVDFVVIGPENQKYAIEVKSSMTQEGDFVGLREFCKINPDFTPCLVSLKNQKISGIKNLITEEILSLSRSTTN